MTFYQHKEANIRKTWLLITLFLIIVIGLGYLFAQIFKNPNILIGAVVFSFLWSFISYWFSDKIVLAVSHAKPIEKKDNPELYRIVENLCITAGLPLPRIYIIEEAQPNAFATGRDPRHAAVAVTAGILERLNKTELEGVLAHELSHIGNRDILVSSVVVVLVGTVAMLSDWFLRWSFFAGHNRDQRGGGLGGIFVLAGILLSIITPLVATLVQLAVSRKREFLADASGVLLTRYPDGLASALEKISKYPHSAQNVTPVTNHLYIESPHRDEEKYFKEEKEPHWLAKLFMTHPPVRERIRILKGMKI